MSRGSAESKGRARGVRRVAEHLVIESPAIALGPPSTAAVPESPSTALGLTTILCAGAPEEITPRGLPTIDLLAHILTGKFDERGEGSPVRRCSRQPSPPEKVTIVIGTQRSEWL
jgi:hypothetical protein